MAEKLKIIPLGGLDEIGKNITVLEYGKDMIVIDCGMGFPDDGMPGVDLVIPDTQYLEENVHKLRGIFLTHGHRYGVKLGRQELAAAADRLGAKIAVYGHTHIPLVEERYGVITLCPGSVSEPRQENRRPTYGVLERTAEKGLFWEIKYL